MCLATTHEKHAAGGSIVAGKPYVIINESHKLLI